jgi:hypothetical protein
MNTGNRPELPLASSGCSCCAPAGAAEPATTLPAPEAQKRPAAVGNSDRVAAASSKEE